MRSWRAWATFTMACNKFPKRCPRRAEMNRFLAEVDFERATSPSGKPTRLYYLTQAGVAPPIFVAFTNRSGKLHFSFERFLENRIRERFGFLGTPIVIKSRARR